MLDAERLLVRAGAVGRRGAARHAAARFCRDHSRHPHAGHERHRAGAPGQAAPPDAGRAHPLPDRPPRRRRRRAPRLRRRCGRLPEQADQRRHPAIQGRGVRRAVPQDARSSRPSTRRCRTRSWSGSARSRRSRRPTRSSSCASPSARRRSPWRTGASARTRNACGWRWRSRRWPPGSGTSTADR